MNTTKIPWTQYSWNPVTGCSKISEGCAHCYAQALAHRFHQPENVVLHPERLDEPFRYKTGKKIFVCSMADLFHEDVPTAFILRVFEVMAAAKQHTFQVLTKRPERMLHLLAYGDKLACDSAEHHRLLTTMPLPNVWLGVTVENQQRANERIPLLLKTPAAVRFVSIEPMLEPVRLDLIRQPKSSFWYNALWPDHPHLDWVICGAESGPGARPMLLQWVRDLRDQCVASGTAFFFKQAMVSHHLGTPPELDGQKWIQFPEAR